MVLGSAQYKRQDNLEEEMVPSGGMGGGGGGSDGSGGLEDDLGSLNSDNLREAGSLGGGGHVRFVDSTIRYHMSGTSYWHGRSGLEKALIVLSLVLTTFCFIMIFIVSSHISEENRSGFLNNNGSSLLRVHSSGDGDEVCLTADCVQVAAKILASADMSANPCQDFYQYSCGGWEQLTSIPDGRTSWSMFEKLWEGNQLVLRNALEAGPTKNTTGAMEKVFTYYESCLDKNDTLEELAGKPLLDIINSPGIGGWKILEKDDDSAAQDSAAVDTASFQRKLQFLQLEYQASGLFSWMVGGDDKNSSLHIIQLDQGGLSLPTRDYYLSLNDTTNKEVIEAFTDMIAELAKLLIMDNEGINQISKAREDSIRKQAEGIVAFETKLANITIPRAQRRNESELYHNMTIGTLQHVAGFLNWTDYFGDAFKRVNRTVGVDEKLVVYAPDYMRNLTKLIEAHLGNATLRRDLENYMAWQLVKSLRNALSKKYQDAGKSFEKALVGKETHHERWRLCVTDTDAVLGYALGGMFIKDAFNGKSKPEAQEMIDGVKEAFKERLASLKWMDDQTRKAAISKANAITYMIGYPDYILDKEALDEKYKLLDVHPNEYFQNTIRFHRYTLVVNLGKLDKPVDRTQWSMTPPTVNAYYVPTKNQIAFPAGLLQNPFFSLKYPKSLNFGAMGVVMGHELSHAFDDQGREYDEKGNMRNWWNNKTLHEFQKRTDCMERQYSSYHMGPQNVSGHQTLGENIADNGGLKASYYAYKQWLKDNHLTEEQPLPGIELTHRQLFFLSFSQVWCSKATPQAKKLQILEDPHSPAKFRVIGVLSNSKEFSEAFNCPVGSPMNPKHKCEVW